MTSLDSAALITMRLSLIQKDDCHLCDLAWEVLAAADVADFESVWMDGDEALTARYGLRVPVLRREDTGAELGWPFDATTVREFLS